MLQQRYVMTLATYSSTRGLRFPLITIILLNRCPRPPCSYVTVKMQLVRSKNSNTKLFKLLLVRIQEFCFWVLLVKLKVGRLRWLGKRLELSRWRNWPSQEKMSITYGRVRPQKILAWFEVFCGKLYEFACLPRQDWWLRWCCSAWLRTRSSAPGLRAFDWGITLL